MNKATRSAALVAALVVAAAGGAGTAQAAGERLIAPGALADKPALASPGARLIADEARDVTHAVQNVRVQTLLDRWQDVAVPRGTSPASWRDMMALQLGMADAATIDALEAIAMSSNAELAATGYMRFQEVLKGDIANRAAKLRSSVQAKTLGSTTADLTFTPINPCRVVDTRNVGGNIASFAARNFFDWTLTGTTDWGVSQGGIFGAASSVCPQTVLPSAPSAVLMTVSVVNQQGFGTLVVWSGTSPQAQAATLNYPATGFFANNTVATYGGRTGVGPGGAVQDFGVSIIASTSAGVAVDVVGYYFPPQATALECQTVESTANTVFNGTSFSQQAPACPTGFTKTGPTFRDSSTFSAGLVINNFYEFSAAQYVCQGQNVSGVTVTLYCGQICCRVPGR